MSEFTIKLRDLMKVSGYELPLHDYPIFDESHRDVLNRKIVDRYYMQEIGQETGELFNHFLYRRMHEIMPYFNQLYQSELINVDPLVTMRIKSISEHDSETDLDSTTTSNATADTTNDSTNKSRAVNSETPQSVLSNTGDYATGIADVIGTTETSGVSTTDGTDTTQGGSTNHSLDKSESEGYQGDPSALLQSYRNTFINVDMMILDAISDLFMQIWSTDQTNF